MVGWSKCLSKGSSLEWGIVAQPSVLNSIYCVNLLYCEISHYSILDFIRRGARWYYLYLSALVECSFPWLFFFVFILLFIIFLFFEIFSFHKLCIFCSFYLHNEALNYNTAGFRAYLYTINFINFCAALYYDLKAMLQALMQHMVFNPFLPNERE